MMKFLCALILLTLSTGCVHKTRIASNPEGAHVVLNDKRTIGETPIDVQNQAWLWTTWQLSLEKEGYHVEFVEVKSKALPVNILACVCTLGILFPVGLAARMPESVDVEMRPLDDRPQQVMQSNAALRFR